MKELWNRKTKHDQTDRGYAAVPYEVLYLIAAAFLLFKVAIIAGNFELAEFIKNHKEADIGEFIFKVQILSKSLT